MNRGKVLLSLTDSLTDTWLGMRPGQDGQEHCKGQNGHRRKEEGGGGKKQMIVGTPQPPNVLEVGKFIGPSYTDIKPG